MKGPEARIEAEIVAYCKARGFLCLKLAILGERGFPDRSVFLPDGRILFVEVKTRRGRPSHQQLRWIERLRDLGHRAVIVRSVREFHAVVENFLKEDSDVSVHSS